MRAEDRRGSDVGEEQALREPPDEAEPAPAAREPAPEPLRVVQRFLNTVDVEDGTDELASPAALVRWLSGHGLVGRGLRAHAADLERALALRSALRDLAAANHGGPAPRGATAVLERTAARARLSLRFETPGAWTLEPAAPGPDAALGRLVALVARAMDEGTWARLKICRNDTCRWAFYDRSKNRSGSWCSMAVCGNRAKARSFRRRHAAGPDAALREPG